MLNRIVLISICGLLFASSASAGLFERRKKADEEAYVEKLLQRLATDPSEVVRAVAAKELLDFDGKTHPAILPSLVKSLQNDPSPMVRSEAAAAIGRVRPPSPKAGFALEQALTNDASETVQKNAQWSLTQYRFLGYQGNQIELARAQTKEPPLAISPGITSQQMPSASQYVQQQPTPTPAPRERSGLFGGRRPIRDLIFGRDDEPAKPAEPTPPPPPVKQPEKDTPKPVPLLPFVDEPLIDGVDGNRFPVMYRLLNFGRSPESMTAPPKSSQPTQTTEPPIAPPQPTLPPKSMIGNPADITIPPVPSTLPELPQLPLPTPGTPTPTPVPELKPAPAPVENPSKEPSVIIPIPSTNSLKPPVAPVSDPKLPVPPAVDLPKLPDLPAIPSIPMVPAPTNQPSGPALPPAPGR
ncbi:MAG: HEAT repeat domain-containing protein [Zavarzinella sp.]